MKNKKFSKFTALNTKQMRQVYGKGLTPPKGKGGAIQCSGMVKDNSTTCSNQVPS